MRRYRPDAPVAAISALILRGDRVVLIRRLADPNRGRWSLPGGAVDLGESITSAVKREILEETGLRIEPGQVLEVGEVIVPRHGRPDYHYVFPVFLAKRVRGTLHPGSDAGEARWVRFRDLKMLDIADTTLHSIELARKRRER